MHLLTGIHFITNSKGPTRSTQSAAPHYWKDGRNVPDVMSAVIEYPETKEHLAFQPNLRVNFISGERERSSTKAATPALACNESYFHNKVIRWDAEKMMILG